MQSLFFRIARIVAIIVAVPLLLAVAVCLWFVGPPYVRTLAWHLRHGYTASIAGHTVDVPLDMAPDAASTATELKIISLPPIFRGGMTFITAEAKGPIRDAPEIITRQKAVIEGVQQRARHPWNLTREDIQGQHLRFLCLRDDIGGMGESLTCMVPGTNLTVSTMAAHDVKATPRKILDTMR